MKYLIIWDFKEGDIWIYSKPALLQAYGIQVQSIVCKLYQERIQRIEFNIDALNIPTQLVGSVTSINISRMANIRNFKVHIIFIIVLNNITFKSLDCAPPPPPP